MISRQIITQIKKKKRKKKKKRRKEEEEETPFAKGLREREGTSAMFARRF